MKNSYFKCINKDKNMPLMKYLFIACSGGYNVQDYTRNDTVYLKSKPFTIQYFNFNLHVSKMRNLSEGK